MDTISKDHRSWNMSRIKCRDTRPEVIVRSLLHHMGYRFRTNSKGLLGRPDIVLAKYKTVVFVHGCFWHRHQKCRYAYEPKSRVDFWKQKFLSNVSRDRRVQRALRKAGWHVLIVWECEVVRTSARSRLIKRLARIAALTTSCQAAQARE